MKNNSSKLIPTRSYHASTRLTEEFKHQLEKRVKRIYINKELTEFITKTIDALPAKDKLAALHFFRKVAVQTLRQPDPEHYAAFKDEYDEELSTIQDEQQHYEPVRFIEAEIVYLTNTAEKLTSEDVNKRLDVMQDARVKLSKDWLTKEEVMTLFHISKSTLDRRVAEGMPAHKKGKAVHFYLAEITDWMKSDAA